MTWTPALAAEAAKLIADVTPLCEKATARPWAYRPREFDDWGFVRSADGGLVARANWAWDEDLNKHRMEGTDPGEPNGTFIASARTSLPRALSLLDAAMKEAAAARKLANLTKGILDSANKELAQIYDVLGIAENDHETLPADKIKGWIVRAEAAETALTAAKHSHDEEWVFFESYLTEGAEGTREDFGPKDPAQLKPVGET